MHINLNKIKNINRKYIENIKQHITAVCIVVVYIKMHNKLKYICICR